MDDVHHKLELNGDTSTFQYFAYGSNMLKERIHINNPTAKVCGVGKLYVSNFILALTLNILLHL